MKRALIALLFALATWSPSALAGGVPIHLPAGEDPSRWGDVLAARGLVVHTGSLPTTGAWVVVSDGGDHWVLHLRDWKGAEQTLNVSPCTNDQEREDLLFLVSTMLGKAPEPDPVAVVPVPIPIPVAVGPVAVPPKTEPVKTEPVKTEPVKTEPVKTSPPATVVKTEPKPEPVSKPKPDPKPVTTAETTKVETSPERGTGLWVSAGGGVGIRPSAGVAGDIRVDGGWHVLPALRLGAGVAFRTPAALPDAGVERVMSDLDVVVEGAWVSQANIAPYAGAYAGVASRSFSDAGVEVQAGALPILGAEGGVVIALGKAPIAVAPSLRVQTDLRSIDLVSLSGTSRLSPVEVRAGVMFVYRPG